MRHFQIIEAEREGQIQGLLGVHAEADQSLEAQIPCGRDHAGVRDARSCYLVCQQTVLECKDNDP
jgi:hypothetical protein